DGRMALADLNDELDLDVEADGADTVGGLVFLSLGHVPDEGEKLDVDGVSIEVLRVDNTRIRRVRLVRLAEADVAEEE
ncbi:MAG TPA: transporter associated domain-containing protein, partial [Chloroflexota bacterium]|nr:transporter associated domain-containing protein [Chloroflexota bacterium]